MHRLGRNGQRAAVRHGVAGVDGQVQQRKLKLRRVGLHGGQARRQGQLSPDVAAQGLAQQGAGTVLQPLVQLDPLRPQGLAAGDGQQPLRQLTAALGGATDIVGKLGAPSRVGDTLHQGQPAQHHLQQVVEVVRDAAGHLPHGLQLLCLAQPGFQQVALRHVPGNGKQPGETAAPVCQRGQRRFERGGCRQEGQRAGEGMAGVIRDALLQVRQKPGCRLGAHGCVQRLPGWLQQPEGRNACGCRVQAFKAEIPGRSGRYDEQAFREAFIDRARLGFAHRQGRGAFLHTVLQPGRQVPHCELPGAGAQCGARGADQGFSVQRTFQQDGIAHAGEDIGVRRGAGARLLRRQDQERQVRPGRLRRHGVLQLRQVRAAQGLLRYDDGAASGHALHHGGQVGAGRCKDAGRAQHAFDDRRVPPTWGKDQDRQHGARANRSCPAAGPTSSHGWQPRRAVPVRTPRG